METRKTNNKAATATLIDTKAKPATAQTRARSKLPGTASEIKVDFTNPIFSAPVRPADT